MKNSNRSSSAIDLSDATMAGEGVATAASMEDAGGNIGFAGVGGPNGAFRFFEDLGGGVEGARLGKERT